MANPLQNSNAANVFGGIPGGLMGQGAQQYTPMQQYYYGPEPDWRQQCYHLSQQIINLQAQVMGLQAELLKVVKVKEWLVGPENGGADATK